MRSTLLGTLAMLAAAGIALPPPSGAAEATMQAERPSLARRTPLSLTALCEGIYCEAYAEGGSGPYSFTWTNMTEMFDADGYSAAQLNCPFYGQKLVTVTVTDSNGSTVKRQGYMQCPNVGNP